MQKSLIVNKNLKIGEKITATDISSMRPSGGISPLFFDQVIHRKLRVNKKKMKRFIGEILYNNEKVNNNWWWWSCKIYLWFIKRK